MNRLLGCCFKGRVSLSFPEDWVGEITLGHTAEGQPALKAGERTVSFSWRPNSAREVEVITTSPCDFLPGNSAREGWESNQVRAAFGCSGSVLRLEDVLVA